jgi:ribosomal protein S3
MEKHRADKAEKDMIQFSEFLSNIKEHFKQNQSQLELQFIEIAQKQKDMENFINQVKANMITIGSNTGSQLEELYNSVEINNKISDNKCINIIKWRDKNTAVSG